jgi:hypothetical protein
MFSLWDEIYKMFNVQCILSESVWRYLPVNYLRRYIGVVGRDLPPAKSTVIAGDLYEADKLCSKGFNTLNFHGSVVVVFVT